jgi:integrase
MLEFGKKLVPFSSTSMLEMNSPRNWCVAILFTRSRRSELLALHWSDVDPLLCQISVTQSLHRLRNRSLVFRQPKTAKGRRLIALSPSLALVLKEHKEKQMPERLMMGTSLKENDLVFSTPEGKPPSTRHH